MDRDPRQGGNKNQVRRPSGSPPPLSLVDTRRRLEIQERRQRRRTAPMAAMAMLVSTVLACGFFVLGRLGYLSQAADYLAGFESFSLRALTLYGVLPLVTASLMLAIYRPPLKLLAGARPSPAVLFAAPVAGFLAGWLLWCLVQLVVSFFPAWGNWLAVPLIWQTGSLYLGRAPLFLVTTIFMTAVLPAATHEFLYRGIIQPVLMADETRFHKSVLPALLAAVMAFDLPGLVVAALLSLLVSWSRVASGSLIASSLVSAGCAAAMLLARTLFNLISQAIMQMPLIDPLRIRVFLATMISILLVLLLAPLALVGAPGRREKAVLKGNKDQPFRLANRVIGLLCVAAAVLVLYLFA